MNDAIHTPRVFSALLLGLLLSLLTVGVALAATGNIDATNKWAWGANVGWVNFAPDNGGVTVYPDHLEGYAWAENVGWIKLGVCTGGSPCTHLNTTNTNYGVNNDGAGNLSGYAWSTSAGWINFDPAGAERVTIDPATGDFAGYAWGENVGWIKVNGTANNSATYKVNTAWRGAADVSIVKTVAPAIVVPGGPLTYTLSFRNSGPNAVSGVVISDSIPLSVTISGVTSSTFGSGVITQTSGSPNFRWTTSDLPVGAGGVITLTGTISPVLVVGRAITNTATITASSDVTATNNSDTAAFAVAAGACSATPDNGGTVFSSAGAQAVRAAIAAASAGDTVKIAGYCAGVAVQGGVMQTVYITQPLTLAGGYTTTNWNTSDPIANPTVLDALTQGRVIYATAAVTVSNLTAQKGSAGPDIGAAAPILAARLR